MPRVAWPPTAEADRAHIARGYQLILAIKKTAHKQSASALNTDLAVERESNAAEWLRMVPQKWTDIVQ
jgi:hypothetical protein